MNPFECGICFERYSEKENRIPRTLTACGHTICELCAMNILDHSAVVCPFDRISSRVPNRNIEELKKNFAILEAIRNLDSLPETDKADTDEEDDDDDEYENERARGIPCDEDHNHLAVFYCTKCEAHFCKRCSITSHSSKMFSSHKVVKVTEKPVQEGSVEVRRLFRDAPPEEQKEKLTVLLNTTNEKIKTVQSCIVALKKFPNCAEAAQQFTDARKNVIEIYNSYAAALANWKGLNITMLKQQVQQQINSEKLRKPGYDRQLLELEYIRKQCLHALKHGQSEHSENTPEYEVLETLLSSTYITAPNQIKLDSVIDQPDFCELSFSDSYNSIRKIIFIIHSATLQTYKNRVAQMGGVEDTFLNVFRWKDDQGSPTLISFWTESKAIETNKTSLENTTYVLTFSIFEIGNLPANCTIVYRGLKKDLGFFGRLAFGNLTNPLFCASTFDDSFVEHVMKGNYQNTSYFKRIREGQ